VANSTTKRDGATVRRGELDDEAWWSDGEAWPMARWRVDRHKARWRDDEGEGVGEVAEREMERGVEPE
jgi:hypothetical protein